MTTLYLRDNLVSDISALGDLTLLTNLNLGGNSISDISPLVANTGLGSGDTVELRGNRLSSLAFDTHIPTLQSRGVTVYAPAGVWSIGEPYTVRMIYFLPNDRPYRAEVVQQMKDEMLKIQTFFAEQMGMHGHGEVTFRIETDPQGEPMVHRMDGQHPESYYNYNEHKRDTLNYSGVTEEINQMFDLFENIYFIIIDNSAGGHLRGVGSRSKKKGGFALLTSSYFWATAHELGHAFGLQHDFNDDAFIMSYGWGSHDTDGQLSPCHAKYLSVHPYFNLNTRTKERNRSTIELISPLGYPVGSQSVPVQFKINDSDGLHQAILFVHTGESHLAAGSFEVKACRELAADRDTVVEFDYDGVIPSNSLTSLSSPTTHPFVVEVVDTDGNVSSASFTLEAAAEIDIPDPNLRAKIENTLGKASGAAFTIGEMAMLTQLDVQNAKISNLTGLEYAINLTTLVLRDNSVSDISALRNLTQLTTLVLASNSILDLSPLVANTGLGQGDEVDVRGNPLNAAAINTHIPTLQQRGVNVLFDGLTPTTLQKVSGDNQKGVPGNVLTESFVVAVSYDDGTPAVGVSITFTVTVGGGTLTMTNVETDASGKAESTLTLGIDAGINTVSVAAAGIQQTQTFNAIGESPQFDLSVPTGTNLIHVPLRVTTVDGMAKPLTSIADLYDALGGANTVNFLVTYDSQAQEWRSYFGVSDTDTPADRTLTDDMGIVAGMLTPVSVRLSGHPLGTNGSSSITLTPGLNFVGLPLRDSSINRVSDLFALGGIGGNVPVIILIDNKEFKAVGQRGDDGDIEITGGQSFILTAQQAATVAISGEAWTRISRMTAATPMTLKGIRAGNTTPVLALRGAVVDERTGVNQAGIRVTVKNLSTSKAVTRMNSSEEVGYRFTVVDIETGRAATIGDILEISAQSPHPFIGVKPLRYTVTAEDVKRGRIQLPALVAYEIPTETELLHNYPNPFNPETWIPYRLAADAFVTLTIYDGSGQVVRTLDVGHRIAAVYEGQSKAIHWDGRNDVGETVASGVYFYTLTAGEYAATRKMVILK